MEKKILTVFKGRDDLGGEVETVLRTKLEGTDVLVDRASSAAEARQRLRDPYDLIITHINIPADSRTSDPKEQQGLRFLEWLEEKGIKTPRMLIIPSSTDELHSAINRLTHKPDVLVGHSKTWQAELIYCAERALQTGTSQSASAEEIPPKANVEISAASKKQWNASFKVMGVTPPPPVPIEVDERTIQLLLVLSESIEKFNHEHPRWEAGLQAIADELKKLLFGNPDFGKHFWSCFGKVGGLENMQIRFKVERSAHPMILEALADKLEEDRWDYWMLKTPIYRSVWTDESFAVSQPPLFQRDVREEHPLNCLIMKADVGGDYVSVAKKELEKLHNIDQEASFLEEFLTDNKAELGVAKVQIIPETDGETCTAELVEEWLTKKGPWHLVHYAGHSFFDRDNKVGYVFFPGNGEPAAVDIETFSLWLRAAKTRFIYLSSCHSSEEDFLYELADHGISSALGFRWDIRDDLAAEHTEIFYTHLRKHLSLEYAFLYTRRDMYKRYKKEIIWAAPVLIMQMPDR